MRVTANCFHEHYVSPMCSLLPSPSGLRRFVFCSIMDTILGSKLNHVVLEAGGIARQFHPYVFVSSLRWRCL